MTAPDLRLVVSPCLHGESENGRAYYALHGHRLGSLPDRLADRPTSARRRRLRRTLARLERVWDVPGLADGTEIEFSPRLSVSLGRTVPERRLIRLRADLEGAPAPVLDEILAHEFAHVAVWAQHGAVARPHGPEWQALVRAAGEAPRTRIDPRGSGPLESAPRPS